MKETNLYLKTTISGLSFEAKIGHFRVRQENRSIRVFFDGDEKEVVINRLPAFQEHIFVYMKTGGELDWDSVEKTRQALAQLRTECMKSYRALIQVNSGGDVAGSHLAGKVKIKLADGSITTRVVPASQVEALEGKLWIPRWLAIDKTKTREFLSKIRLPEAIEMALSRIERELECQVKLLKEAVLPFQDAERREAPLRAARREAERTERKAQIKREDEARARTAEKLLAEGERAAKRIRELPALTKNVTVTGRDWVKNRGEIKVVEWEIKNATVRTSGTRAYIFAHDEDKAKFWKPVKTITIRHEGE